MRTRAELLLYVHLIIPSKVCLNHSQLSKILGFGANQYAKYEVGKVPSESNGKMIAVIKDKDMLLGLLKLHKTVFQPSEYKKILTTITMS
jgi:hypothetical protein